MNANLAAILYLVAGVLFILSLRGLSSPASSRQGNLFGMIGMGIAVATTLGSHPPADGVAWVLVILGIAIGGGVGAVIARRVPMTSMRNWSPPSTLCRHGRVLVPLRVLRAEASTSARPSIPRASLLKFRCRRHRGLTFTGSLIAFLNCRAHGGCAHSCRTPHITSRRVGLVSHRRLLGRAAPLDFWLITITRVSACS